MNETEKRAYALGLIAKELEIDFESEIDPKEMDKINAVLEDSIADEPKTEIGKKMKDIIAHELETKDGEYNKQFDFHKDLNDNKVVPATIFVLELLGKYAKKIGLLDPNV